MVRVQLEVLEQQDSQDQLELRVRLVLQDQRDLQVKQVLQETRVLQDKLEQLAQQDSLALLGQREFPVPKVALAARVHLVRLVQQEERELLDSPDYLAHQVIQEVPVCKDRKDKKDQLDLPELREQRVILERPQLLRVVVREHRVTQVFQDLLDLPARLVLMVSLVNWDPRVPLVRQDFLVPRDKQVELEPPVPLVQPELRDLLVERERLVQLEIQE